MTIKKVDKKEKAVMDDFLSVADSIRDSIDTIMSEAYAINEESDLDIQTLNHRLQWIGKELAFVAHSVNAAMARLPILR